MRSNSFISTLFLLFFSSYGNHRNIHSFPTRRSSDLRVPNGDGGAQAPHINVTLFARGLGKPLRTRVYFTGDAANASDPVLALIPADRRDTLLAKPVAGQANAWAIEIHLQGEAETVFLDV